MKKFLLGIFLSVLLVTNTALAMTFFQPLEIGSIAVEPSGKISIEGASSHNLTYTQTLNDKKYYAPEGTAFWGDGADGLYYIFEKYPPRFGGKYKNFPINITTNTTIYRIDNDGKFTPYLLKNTGNDVRNTQYILLGRLQDGSWVKYFDTAELKAQYFGENTYANQDGVRCQDDAIIIELKNVRDNKVVGELRFKWNDAAQWFGIEHVKQQGA